MKFMTFLCERKRRDPETTEKESREREKESKERKREREHGSVSTNNKREID